jgi:hypothetical protein
MKTKTILSLIAAGFTTLSATAATYVSDFTGLAPGDSLDGFNGWTQSSPNESDEDGTYPWAFGTTIGSTPSAAVGGYYNTDPAPGGEFYASHTVSLSYPGILFDMRFSIVDSVGWEDDGVMYGTERNTFRLGFQNAGSEVFSLVFVPNSGAPDPEFPLGNTLNVFTSINGALSADPLMAIYADQLHDLQVSLLPDGNGNLNYSFSLAAGTTQTRSGVIADANEIDEFQVGILPTNGQYGDNHLAFGNITATIPEPSSLVLIGTALGGFALRRRRQVA